MEARNDVEEKNKNYFYQIFTREAIQEILQITNAEFEQDATPEFIKQQFTQSAEALIQHVHYFCAGMEDYVKEARDNEDFVDTYEKLQQFLSFYRNVEEKARALNINLDEVMTPVWQKFTAEHQDKHWFSKDAFEVTAPKGELVKLQNPSKLDLMLFNLCKQAHDSFSTELYKQGTRKRDVAQKAFKGVSLGLLAITFLPPLAAIYSVLALPWSILTSILRRQIGLWRTIREAIPSSVTLGPKYAFKTIKKAHRKHSQTREKVNSFTDHAPQGLSNAELIAADDAKKMHPLMQKIAQACKEVAGEGMVSEENLLTHNSADVEFALYGEAMAEMIAKAIATANTEVMIQTFAWEAQTPFIQKIHQALQTVLAAKQAARDRGEDVQPLKVYVLIDERGRIASTAFNGKPGKSWPCNPNSLGLFNAPGLVEVHPATFHHNGPGGTHAKTIVVDGQVTIITGANFQASNFGHLPAYDGALKITGPISKAARDDFRATWANRHVRQTGVVVTPPESLAVEVMMHDQATAPMLFVTRRPSSTGSYTNNPQNQAFLTAIKQANEVIRIMTPNLNAPEIKEALVDFVKRGGKLELILGRGFNDERESKPKAGGTNQQTVNELDEQLSSHRGDFELRYFSLDGEHAVVGNVAGAAHVKLMVVDNRVVMFGNANMDVISFNHLHECNVVIDSPEIAARLTNDVFTGAFLRSVPARREYAKVAAVSATHRMEIVKKVEENNGFQTLYLKKPYEWKAAPGQYCELRSGRSSSKLFKSAAILAFASGADDDCVMVTGRPSDLFTHSNHALKKGEGETLEITGPIGTCFPIELAVDRPVLLIGGGSGLTALRSVMNSLPDQANAKLIYSAKTAGDLLYPDAIATWLDNEENYLTLTNEVHPSYHHGRFTEYLQTLALPDDVLVFICGPTAMVKETAQLLHDRGVPTQSIFGSLPTSALQGGPVYSGEHTMMGVATRNVIPALRSSAGKEEIE